jgi:hypothetical protein
MAAPYVTSAEILAAVGITSPTAGDTAWAGKCADAIEAIITDRLGGDTPSADFEARLQVAAELDGAALFTTRSAPHGVLSMSVDGDVVRLGSSQTRALDNVFLPGIG